jgi:hypothetical protein
MLMPFSKPPTTNGQAPAIKTITGQFIARATVNYPSWQRAEDAVRWLRGELQIKPTVKQAVETFRVNAPLMKAARERLERRECHAANGNSATMLSDGAVERIVAEIGPERILGVVDKLTQPSLPFVAAETTTTHPHSS